MRCDPVPHSEFLGTTSHMRHGASRRTHVESDISSPSGSTTDHEPANSTDTHSIMSLDGQVPPLKRKYTLLDIKPDHFETGVPVFKPTMAQFRDFYLFQKSINKYGMQSGIVKVIPPAEWLKNEMPSEYSPEILANVHFRSPINQEFTNHQNCYSINNIEKKRTFNLLHWKKLSYDQKFLIPPMKGEKSPIFNTPTEKDAVKFKTLKTNTYVVPKEDFEDFDYNIDTSIYDRERCEFLESQYWKTISFSTPLYGADSLGSLFTKDQHIWNVSKLPNLLDWLPEKLPGVNDAYLYGGLWKASFSWHLEDQDLYSINYLHFGAPKQWYSISQKDHMKFYNLMSEIFPDDYVNCPEFLRHKTFLASPLFLLKKGIQVNKITHREKEFIITYPYGYHSGFNYGYNLAESVNFALDNWLDIGLLSKRCMCVEDSVGINVQKLIRRLNGEDEEDEEWDTEQTDIEDLDQKPLEITDPGPVIKKEVKKLQSHARPAPKQPKPHHSPPQQCVLCPNTLPGYLLSHPAFQLLDIQDTAGKLDTRLKCHRICASLTPELEFENGIVVGFEDIPKARKNLKCMACSPKTRHPQESGPKTNVCFQCSHPKCARAYHATCSLDAGVLLSKSSTNGNDMSGLCRFHRPLKLPTDARSKYLQELQKFDLVQFQMTSTSEIHAGFVVSHNKSEFSVDVRPYMAKDENDVLELFYDCIYCVPEESVGYEAPENHVFLKINVPQLETKKPKNGAVKKPVLKKAQPASVESKLTFELTPSLSKRLMSSDYAKYQLEILEFGPVYGSQKSYNYIESVNLPETAAMESPVTGSSFYNYMADFSNELMAAYRNDPSLVQPNDPAYLKYLNKQEILKLRLIRRAARQKRKLELEELQRRAMESNHQLKIPKLFYEQHGEVMSIPPAFNHYNYVTRT